MYQLKFTLKQHTPIIHFQHDQDGATLRATEVKPKLDRFIIEKLGKEADNTLTDYEAIYKKGKEIANNKGWLIDKDKGALNYKMKIEGNRFNKIDITHNHSNAPMYFGNQNNSIPKHFKFKELTSSTIVSVSNDLIEKIKEIVDEFFKTTSFGTRQNKGYGSFTIDKNNSNEITEYFEFKDTYYFEFTNNDYLKSLSVIDYFYKWLKSGINYTRYNARNKENPEYRCDNSRYKKSLLYLYLEDTSNSKDYTWEKRWIKEKYFSITANTDTKKFARAILGWASKNTFTSSFCGIEQETALTGIISKDILNANKDNIIERIMSPFYFKPIETNGITKILILIKSEHINEIYRNPNKYNKTFVFNTQDSIKIESKNKKFKLGNQITELLSIKNELENKPVKTNIEISDLKQINDFIKNNKELSIPENEIDYIHFLEWIKNNHNSFIPKNFRWQYIIDNNAIKLEK